jgi:DNA ligase-1
MVRFSQLCESVAASTKRTEKVRLVASYFRTLPVEEAALGALFLCGRVFPRKEERVLSIGFALLLRVISKLSGKEAAELSPLFRRHGDLGAGTEEALPKQHQGPPVSLAELETTFAALAAQRGASGKQGILEATMRRLSPLEAKYLVKVATGELRIGLKESLVEEAIASAYGQPLASVQRANMLLGDISETLKLAAAGQLAMVQLQLFRAISAMLASPVDTPEDLIAAFPSGALVEDKFDGIRAQAHKQGDCVEFYSRTLDRIPEFPELHPPLQKVAGDFILDGEIVGWRDGRAIPFTELQQRLGRKQIDLFTPTLLPVSFVAFDLLHLNGVDLLDVPLSERRLQLEQLLSGSEQPSLQFTRAELCSCAEEVEDAFRDSLQRGNEGLLAKAPESPYVPGRRGQFWIKLKQPLATLDVVVTAAEYGHGKRRGVLSDYTFAVLDGDKLVNIGKAYSGVTDAEIRELTEYSLAHTIEDQGFRRLVTPEIVLEVAFNNVQRSNRHESGYALRFPRIVRLRPDKRASEIDTIERVREIFASQHTPAKPLN